jgi:hypothetical protein
VYGLLAMGLLGAFGSLLVFHIHLMRLGMGTYDWLIAKFTPTAAPSATAAAITTPAPVATSTSKRMPERPVSVTGQAV